MVVILANDLPPAVRGRLKLWFVEPKANVFVSGVKDSVAEHVIDYLYSHCPASAGVLIFRSLPHPPGYEIRSIGPTKRKISEISGLQLVVETLI
jgi:CRISPR-associated protein Cas2